MLRAMRARPATIDDAAEVVRLGALMFESMGLAIDGEWRTAALQRVTGGLTDGTVVAFVVDDPERPGHLLASAAGTVAQRLPGPRNRGGRAGYVQYVCTEAGHRGRGLGREVMEAAVDWD